MPSTVYFTVFAGRRRFLGVLMMYVKPLLQRHVIDKAHLWGEGDRQHLHAWTYGLGLEPSGPDPCLRPGHCSGIEALEYVNWEQGCASATARLCVVPIVQRLRQRPIQYAICRTHAGKRLL